VKHRKSEKRWSPFDTEKDLAAWFHGRMVALGATVFVEPSYRPPSLETAHTIKRRRADMALVIPAASNSLGRELFVVVEVKGADNYSHLRKAHRQIRGAMCGHDWRCNGRPILEGVRPWRGLVLTPGQLHRPFWPDVVAPDSDTGPRPIHMWELSDRMLTEDGASYLKQDTTDSNRWVFWAHTGGAHMDQVWLRAARTTKYHGGPLDNPTRIQ